MRSLKFFPVVFLLLNSLAGSAQSGFIIDRERKNWVKAILYDNLSWQQVSDLKYWSSEAALLYGVRRIPGNFLLDPQGKIIARNLMGPDLVEKLNEVLAEKKTN